MQDEELRLLVLRNADAQRRLGQTKTEAQGYYFARPLPEDACTAFLSRHAVVKGNVPPATRLIAG